MRTRGNHRAIVAVLPVVLGGIAASTRRMEAEGRQASPARPVQASPARPVPAPPLQVPADSPGNPVVSISTSLGEIARDLYKDRAPVSVDTFLRYVAEGFYEGTFFHDAPDLSEKPAHPPIPVEPVIIKSVRVVKPAPVP
jgi:Cyclophilin type peptidyl-prolyl cis-trans isomerase/CLD